MVKGFDGLQSGGPFRLDGIRGFRVVGAML